VGPDAGLVSRSHQRGGAAHSTHQTADDTAQVEYYPKPGDVTTFVLLQRVGHHDGALRGPEDAGADAEEESSEDDVAEVLGDVVTQIAGGVDRIAGTAESECPLDADPVSDAAGEEANDRKGRIERGVGSIAGAPIQLTAATEPVEGIEHACTGGGQRRLSWAMS